MINDINNEKRKETMIRELGVFELRGVARQLGVSSPTTKKREELIALILEASRNGRYIEDNFPKRGRPFKKLNILDSLTNKITPDKTSDEMSFEKVVFAQETTMPIIEKIEDELLVLEGIVRKSEDNASFFDILTNSLVFITKNDANFNKICTGDLVKCEARKLSRQNQFISLNVLEINGIFVDNYNSEYPDLGEPVIGNETLPFSTGEIILGRRNIYKLTKDIFEDTNFDNLYEKCNMENIRFVVLGANTSFENQIKFKTLTLQENFTTVYGSSPEYNLNKVIDAIHYVYRLFAMGEKVMLFVTDIVDVIRSLDENFDIEYDEEHSSKTKVIIHKLMSFAGAYESGKNGTVVICYNENDTSDKLLVNELFKISKKIN